MTREELGLSKTKLEAQLRRILAVTHAEVDTEYVRMAAEVSRLWRRNKDSTPQFLESKKTIHVELDLSAIDIILALSRIVDGTYGMCPGCNAEIPYQILEANPTQSVCTHCRESLHAVNQN